MVARSVSITRRRASAPAEVTISSKSRHSGRSDGRAPTRRIVGTMSAGSEASLSAPAIRTRISQSLAM
jgi:hypothetical protein